MQNASGWMFCQSKQNLTGKRNTDKREISMNSNWVWKRSPCNWLFIYFLLILFVLNNVVSSLKDHLFHPANAKDETHLWLFPKNHRYVATLDLILSHTTLILEMVATYPLLMEYPCLSTERNLRNKCCKYRNKSLNEWKNLAVVWNRQTLTTVNKIVWTQLNATACKIS